MKPVKHPSAYGKKLATVPELSYKKQLFNSPLSPKPKEKHSVKVVREKLEPMVLRSPPTGESIVRFALPIPSSKTKELIAEDELLRKITKHLKMVVSSLEETYGISTENVEKPVVKPAQEELSLSVGDDLNSFLLCCSQFSAQLEEAVQEERHILESLFKWFQQQVNQMEEISKDQNFSEVEFPASDKTVTLSIAQVGKHAQKLEELKNRLREGSRFSWRALISNSRDSITPSEAMQSCENIKQKIEEFIKAHSTEEFIDVFPPEPQTAYSVSNQLTAMLKIFEKQSNMLQRARSDQVLLETKYKQMQNDFQLLSEEKLMLENELQKLKDVEKLTQKTKPTHDQTKKTIKIEKKYAKEKSEDSEEKKPVIKELKIKEDFLKTQKLTQKAKPTYDRTKKTMKIEKKYAKEKSEDSEEKKSLVKDLKIKEDFLKSQEAEIPKLQLTHFLNQGELLKTGEMIRTTMERSISKTEIKGEDLKYIPLEKEKSKPQVADSSGQDINGKIQEHPQISVVHSGSAIENRSEKKRASPAISDLSQILKSQDESAVIESSKEVSADEDQSPMPPSKSSDKSLLSKEIQDLLPGNETMTTSFVSLPVVTERKSMESDTSKADILEEILQSKTEKQTYQEEREFQAHDKIPHENLTLENEMLSTLPMHKLVQKPFRMKRRNAIFIAQQNVKIPDEDQLPEVMDLFLRSQSQTKNLETTRNETFNIQDDVTDEKLMLEHQDSIVKTQMKVKKPRTSKRKRYITHDGVSGENLILIHEDSMSEKEMQVEKQMTSQDEGLITLDEIPDKSLMLKHQDSVSKTQLQLKEQKSLEGEKLNNVVGGDEGASASGDEDEADNEEGYLGAPHENLVSVNQETNTFQMQVKKQITFREDKHKTYKVEEVLHENLLPEDKDALSKNQFQPEKHGTAKMEILNNQNMNKHSDRSFTLGDLELATQRLTVQNEADSELPHTAENLPAMSPSINDLIFQLDLNKVVEIDIEHLKGAVERRMLMAEKKIQSKSLLEADIEQLLDVTERGAINSGIEMQSKSHPGTNVELLSDATGSDMTRGQLKKQSMNLPEADTERLLDVTRRVVVKEGIREKAKSHPGTNVGRLSDATGSGMTRGQLKKQSMNLPEADTELLLDITGRGVVKAGIRTQSKSHPGTNVERLSDATGSGMTRGQLKKQSMTLSEADTEQLLDASGRGFIKWGIRTQSKSHVEADTEQLLDVTRRVVVKERIRKKSKSHPESDRERLPDVILTDIIKRDIKSQSKSHPETDIEYFTDTVGRENIIGEIKTQLQSYPGVNLFKNKAMSTQHQDFLNKPIEPSKVSTSVNKFSPFDNQGITLFENKDFFPKHVTPRIFPTKVINLSPFSSKGETYKNFLSYVTQPPKALHRTFGSSSYKSTHLPSLKKETSGHPKKLNKNSVGFTIAVPNVISKAGKTTHKVPYTAAQKSSGQHTLETK